MQRTVSHRATGSDDRLRRNHATEQRALAFARMPDEQIVVVLLEIEPAEKAGKRGGVCHFVFSEQ